MGPHFAEKPVLRTDVRGLWPVGGTFRDGVPPAQQLGVLEGGALPGQGEQHGLRGRGVTLRGRQLGDGFGALFCFFIWFGGLGGLDVMGCDASRRAKGVRTLGPESSEKYRLKPPVCIGHVIY